MSNPPTSALIEFIKETHTEYYGKILELRREVEEWLAYIPNTFQHYTTHTIKHSDEIVNQISNLLFKDDDHKNPVVKLSGVEAYILVAAAYLHDAGMVTSEKEKSEILESETWKKWISGEESREKRWNDIKLQRETNPAVSDPATRNFLADLQTRFMIAEFVRGQHHIRAGNVIELHHDKLGRIDFGNAMLRDAIAQVCVGHGLRQHELEDNERFPESRDIRGEKVNLRFLAILLRLGDLLDMSETRACPLLLNAASPLPPDSLAHWSQYEAITHRLTAPDSIEVTAKCRNQDEDRVLRDWCQWIVEEVQNAKIVMSKARRHKEWQVPDAALEGDKKTIKINPAPNAKYIPSKWQLDFDKQAIFNLLAEDLYKNPMVFVRELIQNALDAIRCKMYEDLREEGKELPEYPTQVPEDFRYRYSVRLSITEREKINEVSGETEKQQVLVIEDDGIGMDTDIIEKYFLQVGRSFYKSDEFRRNFQFVPTSRFGIGFLSVFAASNNVSVDSYKPTSEMPNNKPVKITLTGLRNYLLRDKSERDTAGTRIEIILRENVEQGELTEMTADWCRRVEFPVKVNDFGEETTITAERPEDFTFEHQLVTNPNAKFVLRAFPVNSSGIEGHIYILAYIDENGEDWVNANYKKREYLGRHPLAELPADMTRIECFHGIKVSESEYGFSDDEIIFHLDFRHKKYTPSLSRGNFGLTKDENHYFINEFVLEYEKILMQHLDELVSKNRNNLWIYKNELVYIFPPKDFWGKIPETIRIFFQNSYKLISLNDFLLFNEFYTISQLYSQEDLYPERYDEVSENLVIKSKFNRPVLTSHDASFFSDYFKRKVFLRDYSPYKITQIDNEYALTCWKKNTSEQPSKVFRIFDLRLVDFEEIDIFSIKLFTIERFGPPMILYNKNHPYAQWLIKIEDALNNGESFISKFQYNILLNKFASNYHNLNKNHLASLQRYIEGFKSIVDLPIDLQPPNIDITPLMFGYRDDSEAD